MSSTAVQDQFDLWPQTPSASLAQTLSSHSGRVPRSWASDQWLASDRVVLFLVAHIRASDPDAEALKQLSWAARR